MNLMSEGKKHRKKDTSTDLQKKGGKEKQEWLALFDNANWNLAVAEVTTLPRCKASISHRRICGLRE